MRDDHIIKMLEEQGVGRLSEAEISVIESHTSGCQDCLRAYEAARISAALIQSRAAETVEASPFFKTRVMAAIRERKLSTEQPAIVRMWRAAGSLVSTMAVLVVILVGMTVFNFDTDSQVQNTELIAGQSMYSPEYVLFDQGEAADDGLQYDQVLATIYESGEGDGQ